MNRVTRVLQVDPVRPDPEVIAEAAAALQAGRLVAFPTETVYGLGANALDPAAVADIFAAKDRPATDPVIVHLAHLGQLGRYAVEVPEGARRLALAFWPGPLTLILRKHPSIPDIVTAGLPSVALRVPAHRVARALIETTGVPVAAPSANRFSRPSPTTAAHVRADLDGRIDLILDGGAADIGVESTIVDLTVDPPVLRRPGGIALEQVRELLPDVQWVIGAASAEQPQRSPGQLTRHYAPRAPLTVYQGEPEQVVQRVAADARSHAAEGARVGVLAPEEDLMALAPLIAALAATGRIVTQGYGARGDPARAARELFGALRQLDEREVTLMLAIGIEASGLGLAISDRLFRAAEGRVRRV